MRFEKKYLFRILLISAFMWIFNPDVSHGQVHILYTANLNGALMGCNCPGNPYGGVDRIIGTIKSFKKNYKNVLTIDSGDFFGTYPDKNRDEIIWSSYADLPYDCILPGDQEFIYGMDNFEKKVSGFKGRILQGAIKNINPQLIEEHVFTFDNIKIAIIGWHTDESFSFIRPEKIEWEKETNIIVQRIEKLKPDVNIVVLVSHSGYEQNIALVKSGVRPDIIICGHSQETIEELFESVLLVQPGMDGEMIGHLEIILEGNTTSKKNEFIRITKDSPIDMEIRDSIIKLIVD